MIVAKPISIHRSQENICNAFSRCFSARLEISNKSASDSETEMPDSLASNVLGIALCFPQLYKPVNLIAICFIHIVQNTFCSSISLLKDSGISVNQSVHLKNFHQLLLDQVPVNIPDNIDSFDLEVRIGKVGGGGWVPVVPYPCNKFLDIQSHQTFLCKGFN